MSTRQKFEFHSANQVTSAPYLSGASPDIRISPSAEERTFSLFQPDILLPTQYFATAKRKDHVEPEKKLMLAILEDAVWCFQRCLLAQDKRRNKLFSEAEDWVLQENGDWLFSFESICEVLGLNPKYVREGLMHWKARTLTTRAKTQVYRLNRVGERKKRRAVALGTRGHKFLKAAGY